MTTIQSFLDSLTCPTEKNRIFDLICETINNAIYPDNMLRHKLSKLYMVVDGNSIEVFSNLGKTRIQLKD